MSNGEHDIFALVINFLKVDWQLKHITIGLFETSEITRQVLVRHLITLCDAYGLRKKIVAYVKKWRVNLNAMTITLKSMISWEIFSLDENFQGTCSSHAFSKTCQYGTTKEFFCKNLKYVSIKVVQLDLQKCQKNLESANKNVTKLVWFLKFAQES
jgi:hypothetical protein